MDVGSLTSWLAAYGEAWEMRDPDKVAALFTEDALYYETPFSEPARGQTGVRSYWSTAVEDHRNVKFSFEVLAVSGRRGIAWWAAEFTRAPSGDQAKLDGVFVLEFDESNLCRELREWWFITTV